MKGYFPERDPDENPEEQELRAEVAFLSKRHQRLLAHPDCNDPDHPGCKYCWPDEHGEQENDIED